MATRNINNYINELLNEVHEPGHVRGDLVQMEKDRQAERDRRRQGAEEEYASGRRFFDPTKNPMDGIRDDQKPTKKPLSSEERELAILRAQAKSRTNSMGERLAARKALKAMENQAAPGKTIGDMGKEMDKMRDGFLSNLDNFTSGKGITDNLQASGSGKKPKKDIPDSPQGVDGELVFTPDGFVLKEPSGKKPKKDTPGREIEKIPVERRPKRPIGAEPMAPGPGSYYPGGSPIGLAPGPGRRPDDGRPNIELKPKPFFPGRRPDDGRPVAEKKPYYPGGRPDDGRPVREPKPAYIDKRPEPIGKRIEAGTLGKNKRLARAAQADKTGDAYMAQVMGQGKATAQSEYQKRIDAAKDREKDRMMNSPDARPDSRIRDTMFRVGRDDQNYRPAIPRKRMDLKSREITPTPSMGGY